MLLVYISYGIRPMGSSSKANKNDALSDFEDLPSISEVPFKKVESPSPALDKLAKLRSEVAPKELSAIKKTLDAVSSSPGHTQLLSRLKEMC